MASSAIIRVLIAKAGLNGHLKGALLVMRQVRHAGIKECYIETGTKIDQIIDTALQKNVHIIAINVMSGEYISLANNLSKRMREKGISDKLLIMVGAIPDEDIQLIQKAGVLAFTSGDSYDEIIDVINYAVESCHDRNLVEEFHNFRNIRIQCSTKLMKHMKELKQIFNLNSFLKRPYH